MTKAMRECLRQLDGRIGCRLGILKGRSNGASGRVHLIAPGFIALRAPYFTKDTVSRLEQAGELVRRDGEPICSVAWMRVSKGGAA